ncbi:MAG TPA: hypothetical protein VE153_09915 [Myxococcus sp.]|jgi:hypothetical protein|nr:hypothetical protein [Myxococcus sp.]
MKKLALAVILAVTTACGTVEDERFDGYVSEVVSVDELLAKSDGAVSLDLRQAGVGYKLSHGTDLSRIYLVCPNGQAMHMEDWIVDRGAEFGVSFEKIDSGFVLMPSKSAQVQVAAGTINGVIDVDDGGGDGGGGGNPCPAGCYLCTDGLCVCP